MAGKICPVWVGHLLLIPLRRWAQNPERILGPYVKRGMTVLDVGCGMGYFSLPMARLVGATGRVVCVDLQQGMLRSLTRRAARQGLSERIEARLCPADSLGLNDCAARFDFALMFAVVHETPDAQALFRELAGAMKSGASCLLAEPKGHVSAGGFAETVAVAEENGFRITDCPRVARSHTALLKNAMRSSPGQAQPDRRLT